MNNVFCLMGPTASGKTALACELFLKFPFEIISVDSAMIYREMDIGTAKPSAKELVATPHHLIDILDPPQSFSVAQFCEAVLHLTKDIFQRGKIPLLVGGTMMYFNALQKGLSILPEANESVRRDLNEQAAREGWPFMHRWLLEVDPLQGAKIHAHDTQRIQRALEVFLSTGTPLSSFFTQQKSLLPYNFVNLVLFPEERSWLHERIAARFRRMLELGFINEVEELLQKWQLNPICPAMRCVGYRQAYDYLAGLDDYQTFCNKGIYATRQLAKRQLTWLRSWPEAHLFPCDKEGTSKELIAIIGKILDNTPPVS